MNRQMIWGALAGIIMGVSVGAGLAPIGASDTCSRTIRADVTCDYRVNSLDLWAVAHEFGLIITPASETPTPPEVPSSTSVPPASSPPTITVSPEPSATSTPSVTTLPPTATRTATPTAIAPTATSTATRIPAPASGTALDNVIDGLSGNNPACVAGTDGFDWGGLLPFSPPEVNGPVNRNRGTPPNGATRLTIWLMMNHQANCNGGAELSPGTNGQITVSGMRVWVLLNTGEWRSLDPRIWGWQDNVPWYGGIGAEIYDSACCFNAGPPYTVPHNRGKQAYTGQNTMPSGVVGFLAVYNLRATGGMLMTNCGADYYSSTGGYMGDLYVGKFHAAGASDTQVSCTNVSEMTLRLNPPPLP